MPYFRALKINGNENRKDFDLRTKPFHEIVLLWTMRPVHGIIDVFTVPDRTTRNSKVGYGHIWTGHHKRNSERISEIADFSLIGEVGMPYDVLFSPYHKQNIWRLTIKSQAPKWKNPSTIRCPWQTAFKCWNQSSEGDGENSKASPANPRRNRIAFECFGLSRVRCAS